MLGILEGEPGGKQGRSGRPLGTWRPQEGGDFVPRQQVLASGLCGHRASPLLSWSPVEGRGTAICAIPAWWLPSAEGEWARGLGPGLGGCGWPPAWALRWVHQSLPWQAGLLWAPSFGDRKGK